MDHRNRTLDIANRRNGMPLCMLAAILLWTAPVAEANWRISPVIGAGIEYNDNVFLNNNISGLSSSDTGYTIQALARFVYDAQLTDVTITPRLRSIRYRDDSDLDSNDQFLDFRIQHDRQKSNFGFRGSYSSESVRTAELSDVDFDIEDPADIPADDTGRVFATGKRDRVSLDPEFSYALSQRTSLSLDANYIDVTYDKDVPELILSGFTEYGIGAALSYAWSENDTISIGARAGKYEPDRSEFDSASTAVEIGYNHRLSERTLFRLRVGSDTSEDQNREDQTNAVAEISLIHRYQTTRMIASYRRTVDGSGSSQLSLRDAVTLNFSRNISPKLTLSAGVGAYTTNALDSTNLEFVEDDYLQVRALARWNVSRTVAIDLDYRYTDIERKATGNIADSSDSNRIGLWIFWHPKPLAR